MDNSNSGFDQYIEGIEEEDLVKTDEELSPEELEEALAVQEENNIRTEAETTPAISTPQEFEEIPVKSEFEMKLEAAKKILSTRGKYAGLCEFCLGTDKIYTNEDGYSGIQGRMEGDVITFTKCTHGRDITKDYDF